MTFLGYNTESLLLIMATGLVILTIVRILFARKKNTDHFSYERFCAWETKMANELRIIHQRLDQLEKHLHATDQTPQ